LLKSEDVAVRRGAAAWLCGRQSPDGLPVLLESNDLSWLNALRAPEAWERMSNLSLSVESGTLRQAMESLARELGVRLETSDLEGLSEDVPVGGGFEALQFLIHS